MQILHILPFIAGSVIARSHNKPWTPSPSPTCLADAQASQIATRYLSRYDTGAVTQLSDISSVVAPGFTSYDETGTGPYSNEPTTIGIEAWLASLTASGPSSFTNATQYPLFVIHDCDTIAYRWRFEAWSTGYNSTVPAGTYLEFKGIDIITVDLSDLLVTNATSSGDWINLARELGQIGNYFL